MRRSSLVGAGLALILSACAGLTSVNPAAADAATNSQQSTEAQDPVLAAFQDNLPKGETVGSASVRQLTVAVKRTLIAHPEMSDDLAAALVKAAPGRKKLIQKIVSTARAAYVRQSGHSGKPAPARGVNTGRR